MTIEQLEDEIQKLGESEKKRLLRRLIADLDEGRDEDVKCEWLEEVQRRYREMKEGVLEPIPGGEAIAKARERLRNGR